MIGNNPEPIPKKVYVVVPHTSNMDFVLGMLVKTYLGITTNFLAKHSLFWWPVGWFARKLGLLPIDRTKKNGFINQAIALFDQKEKISIGVAAEGTRSHVDKLKSGFYHIARGANVPIILVTFDWANRQVIFSDPYYLSDDKEKEMKYIENYFAGVVGYHREKSFKI